MRVCSKIYLPTYLGEAHERLVRLSVTTKIRNYNFALKYFFAIIDRLLTEYL